MKTRASFASRVVAAARPSRPWLRVNASPRAVRFLVAAGARPGPGLLRNAYLGEADLSGVPLRVRTCAART